MISEKTLFIIFIIMFIIIFILLYMINKLEKRIERLECNNNSFMELLFILQNGGKIERVEKGVDE